MKYDVIVCGGGVQGLWTANHLVEQNKQVLLIEQFPFFHSRGSSHGASRTTRYSYITSHHAKMMAECFVLWNKLEKSQNISLFVNCGLLSLLNADLANKMVASFNAIKSDFRIMNSDEVNQKFPGILANGLVGVYESSAGVLKANKCLLVLQKYLNDKHVVMHDEEKVNYINPINDNLVEVHTDKDIYQSKSVVLTCGPWINKLLKPLNLQLPVKVFRVCVEYWKALKPGLFSCKNFPAMFISNPGHCFDVYSTPILEYPGMMKVCLHNGVEVAADQVMQYDREKEKILRYQIKTMISNYYPNLIPDCAIQETCLYTKTPDDDFILDRHPRYKNVIIGAGFSGHGFKLAPVVGKILADMACERTPHYPTQHFSLKRFKKPSKL